jgi:hypothetical protein
MTKEDFEFVADALLALCEDERRRPFYSENTFRCKLRREAEKRSLVARLSERFPENDLLRSECMSVFERARLTPRQTEVLADRLEGWTFEEIGRKGGHSKQGAQSIFVQSLRKLTQAFRAYPYRGLSEVYRKEIRRGRLPARAAAPARRRTQ